MRQGILDVRCTRSGLRLIAHLYRGHLNPSLTIAATLQKRGYDVRVAALPDVERFGRAMGIRFHAVAEEEFPLGRVPQIVREIGQLRGLAASRATLHALRAENVAHLRHLPGVLEREKIDALVLDQIAWGPATVAQQLRIPYVSISNALWLSRDLSSPPWIAAWPHVSGLGNRLKNWLAHLPLRFLISGVFRPINKQRAASGLARLTYCEWAESPLAVISQQPPGFEFPEVTVPRNVYFTGPFHSSEDREPIPFPFELLDGRPLIYTSMGTIQNQLMPIFRSIAAACQGLNAQVVIAMGVKGVSPPQDLAGNPIVVDYAPQLELIRTALARRLRLWLRHREKSIAATPHSVTTFWKLKYSPMY